MNAGTDLGVEEVTHQSNGRGATDDELNLPLAVDDADDEPGARGYSGVFFAGVLLRTAAGCNMVGIVHRTASRVTPPVPVGRNSPDEPIQWCISGERGSISSRSV